MNQNLSKSFQIEPIGYIKSPYKEKFAVPRQPGLAPNAISTIEFYPPFNDELAFIGLEAFLTFMYCLSLIKLIIKALDLR